MLYYMFKKIMPYLSSEILFINLKEGYFFMVKVESELIIESIYYNDYKLFRGVG